MSAVRAKVALHVKTTTHRANQDDENPFTVFAASNIRTQIELLTWN